MAELTGQPTISDPGLEQVQPLLIATRLRNVLRVNAVVSGLSGLATALASGWVAEVMGVSMIAVRVVGVGLVLFAVGVGLAGGWRQRRLPALARLIGVADAGWVAATAVLVATGAFSAAGIGVAVTIGVVVAGFAALDLRGPAVVVSAPPVADVSPPLEAITIAAEVGASAERAWAVVTDHELYGRLAPNLGRVELTRANGPELARHCTDNSGRGWSESCTLWDEGRRFAVAVDTSDYPYPLQTMRGSWSVGRLAPARSRLGMTFLFQPRPRLRGRLFVWVLHAAFPVVLRRILRGWNDALR
jgi:Polyketide cyclase / dehydrase and lipid transport